MIKKIISPLIIGGLFYAFILLGRNSKLISNNSILTWTGIIGGALLLYIIIFGIVRNPQSITLGIAGVVIAKIAVAIAIPISIIFNYLYSPTDNDIKNPQSLLEKEKIDLVSNPEKCSKIKYGTFLYGSDTLIRYTKNNKDFELIKSYNKEKTNRINWIDSCSYIRIDQRNNSVTKYIRLGNFNNGSHQMYSKPAISHKMEEEDIETITEIKK